MSLSNRSPLNLALNRIPEIALLLLTLPSSSNAYWRMSCSLIQTSRIDPIVNPGSISSHVHKISGASTIYTDSTYDSLFSAPCTSCEIQDDKSAYWTPQLYYQHSNGSFEEVPNGGTVVYYLGRGDNRTNIVPFPKGFRMLSGNANVRSYDSTTKTASSGGRPVADRVSFNCLNYAQPNPETPGLPTQKCPQGLRAQIQFQSCWNGVDLYKTDQSHVAYLSQIDNGVCPSTHPVPLPHLFFEVLYDTNSLAADPSGGSSSSGRLVFSQGDPTGYGFHGDFLNGWDMATQTDAVANCLNTDNAGQISACPALTKSQVGNYANTCPERAPAVNEPVKGMLAQLPGCVTVTPGPAPASSADTACAPNSPQASTNPQPSSAPAPRTPAVGDSLANGTWVYAGCAAESSSGRALSTASFTSDSMTNDACVAFCAGKGLPLAGTEYGRECYCGTGLSGDARLGGGSDCARNGMLCAGNSSSYCGGPGLLSVWNATSTAGRTGLEVGKTTVGGWVYAGCTSEGSGSRALTGATFSSGSGMTNEACGTFCRGKGFGIFGTEYGAECYCGNRLEKGAGLGQSGCSMGCSGAVDKGSVWAPYVNVCGGPNRLTLFNATAGA